MTEPAMDGSTPPMDPAAWAAFMEGFQSGYSGSMPQGYPAQPVGGSMVPPWAGRDAPPMPPTANDHTADPRAAAAWALWQQQSSAGGSWQDASAAPWGPWSQKGQQTSPEVSSPQPPPPPSHDASAGWPTWQGATGRDERADSGRGERSAADSSEAKSLDSDALTMKLLSQQLAAGAADLSSLAQEPSGRQAEDEDFANDMLSAVRNFLDGGDESDEEDEDEDSGRAARATKPPVPQSPPPPPPAAAAPEAAADAPQAASPTSAQAGAAQASPGSPVPQAVASMPPAPASPPPAPPPPKATPPPPKPTEPSPEGMQDFLSVLRQRKLPAEVADRRKELEELIMMAVFALYSDRIRPVLAVAQRRLKEQLAEERWEQPVVQAACGAIVPLCAQNPESFVVAPPMNGQAPVIYLVNEPEDFKGWVDVEGAEDGYGEELWDAFAEYLQGPGGNFTQSPSLPGNFHGAAQDLQRRKLKFLEGLSLAEVEHIVRLSVGRRRLLQYHGDNLRPRAIVESIMAKKEVPKKPDVQQGDIQNMDDLIVVLLQMMSRFHEGVPLSLVKQHIQTYCRRTLSEASFKCAKLVDLFRREPLSGIFPLVHSVERNEIMVKPARRDAIPPHLKQKASSWNSGAKAHNSYSNPWAAPAHQMPGVVPYWNQAQPGMAQQMHSGFAPGGMWPGYAMDGTYQDSAAMYGGW